MIGGCRFWADFRVDRRWGSGEFFQRQRVDAVAQAAGLRAVGEDVAEVGIADGTGGFDALHAVAGVEDVIDEAGRDGLGEAGPAAATVEFGLRVKQWFAAADASVAAGFENRAHRRTEGAFGAFLAGDVELFRRQHFLPVSGAALVAARRQRVAVADDLDDAVPGQQVGGLAHVLSPCGFQVPQKVM